MHLAITSTRPVFERILVWPSANTLLSEKKPNPSPPTHFKKMELEFYSWIGVISNQVHKFTDLTLLILLTDLIALPKFDYKKYNMKVPDIEQYFLESDKKIMAALNDEIFDYLEAGSVRAVPGVSEFNKDGVKLSDGQELKLDAVVIATG